MDHPPDDVPLAERKALYAQTGLIRDTMAVILAGGRGTRLGPLTRRRAKPAVPFGGKFRIIDFPLSNCINSGVRRIAIVTQYMAQSLLRHTQEGWNFLDARVSEFVEAMPAQQRAGDSWYLGTADAVHQNADLLQEHRPRHVLVLAGDHVYRMDYSRFLADHVQSGADVSVACMQVPLAEAHQFGIATVGPDSRIVRFDEKPQSPRPLPGADDRALASMGIYVFPAELLYEELVRDAADRDSTHDFGRDLIPALVGRRKVIAHDFAQSCVRNGDRPPYWRDVGTVDAYWAANIDLTLVEPELNLYDPDWPILTASQSRPPAKFVFSEPDRRGIAVDSLVSSGCIVSGGTVQRSLLSTNVRIHSFADVQDSVLLPDVSIGRHAVVRRAIVDRHCVVPAGLRIGVDPVEDAQRFHVSPGGVVVVTQEMLDDLELTAAVDATPEPVAGAAT
jgi:glucose-1-phosphate adenylyltransferase